MGESQQNSRSRGSVFRRVCQSVIDTLAPQTCIYCQQMTDRPEAICNQCFAAYAKNDMGCPRCALPDTGGSLCPTCQNTRSPLDRVIAPYVYDPAIAFLLKRWKFEKQRYCSEIAAKLALKAPFRPEIGDILLATPLHWRRRVSRGFNQSEDLLQALQASLPVRWGHRRSICIGKRPSHIALRRRRATAKQSLATREQRVANLKEAFRVSGDLSGRSVVLIDDVCTTGATGESMARILRDAGATSVKLWCIARTPSRR